MIRFIIESNFSNRDISGNVYNMAKVTSTKTGDHLWILGGWGSNGSNARSLVNQAIGDRYSYSNAIHTTGNVYHKIREFDRLEKEIKRYGSFVIEHETEKAITMIQELEKGDQQ